MSAITIENDLVHYEVLGRGRPVILLHGWLGSWRYWIPAMQQLSMKYRTYALDLWGFGDSGKDSRRYDFASQVNLLDQFVEKMGIGKVALIGHGLGASVAARYAVQHPDRVPRLMVIAPPLFRMAPPSNPLAVNTSPAQLPAGAPSGQPVALPPVAPVEKTTSPEDIQPEAETMPFRTDEMRKRIEAALRQSEQEKLAAAGLLLEKSDKPDPTPKSPRDAATPPADKPATEIGPPSAPAAPNVSEASPELPTLVPRLESVPNSKEVQVQQPNPLKEHLQVLDPQALLERHVDAGADQEKLKVEVSKADKFVIALNVESFAGVDTLRDLQALSMPAVTVYGKADTFMPLPDAPMVVSLKEGRTTFHVIEMEDIRHFPMLESIAPFARLLLDFLEVPDVTKLKIQKTWERRVR